MAHDLSDVLSMDPRKLVSPRGLSNVPSKVSLATERAQTLSIASPNNSQARLNLNSKLSNNQSPSPKNFDTLRRELKQLNKWLDNREIQVRADLESETAADRKLELNSKLEQTFQNTMTQLKTKLPGGQGNPLDLMMQRIMNGLHECFQAEGKQYQRKLALQDKEIQALIDAKDALQGEFDQFKATESVEAYFERFQSITDRKDPNKGD